MKQKKSVKKMRFLFTFLLFIASVLAITPQRAQAKTGVFRVVIIRTLFSDVTSGTYTITQLNNAAGEIRNFYHMLSNGKLDLHVTVTEVSLSNTSGFYWNPCAPTGETRNPCPPPLIEDAAEAAATGGFNFGNIDGILILSPWGGGAWANSAIFIDRPGVKGTFQRAYIFEDQVDWSFRLFDPPGPSNVWWGGWAHEIGHMLQFADSTPLGGNWNGHPSSYASGYDLMDSCYPCGESAYGLSGYPVMSGPKKVFPHWLNANKVLTVNPEDGEKTVVLSPLSMASTEAGKYQALKVLKAGLNQPHRYYLVQPRVRTRADAQRGEGIYDEGIQILDIDETQDPPVHNMYPCLFAPVPQDQCIIDAGTDPRFQNCILYLPDGNAYAPTFEPIQVNGITYGPVPAYCWPHPLWHVGDIFSNTLDPSDNIEIRIDAEVEDGWVVTVSGGPIPDAPDTFIIPSHTPPMNKNETVDIWIDSSCNGYEEVVGQDGLTFKRRLDGTVIGNGDMPCANHENRIYARVRNGGSAPADNILVHFYVPTDLSYLIGVIDWMEVGVADYNTFSDLASLDPGKSAEVFVTWTPQTFPTEEGIYREYPTSVRIVITPVASELFTGNQTAKEVFGHREAHYLIDLARYVCYDPFWYIKNPVGPIAEKDPRTFFIDVIAKKDIAAEYHLGIEKVVTLNTGEERQAPLLVEIPVGEDNRILRESISSGIAPEPVELEVQVITLVTTENKAVSIDSPYRFSTDALVVGGSLFQVHPVEPTTLSLETRVDYTNFDVTSIVSSGSITPSPGKSRLVLDYKTPEGKIISRLVETGEDGSFSDVFAASSIGNWMVTPLYQGNFRQASSLGPARRIEIKPKDIKKTNWAMSIHSGIGLLLGTFNADYDPGISRMIDISLDISPHLAMVGMFGYNSFKSSLAGIADNYWINLSLNIKGYLSHGDLHPFIIVGPGYYFSRRGNNGLGCNVGLGVDYEFSKDLTIEFGFDYHTVFKNTVDFLINHIGIILRF